MPYWLDCDFFGFLPLSKVSASLFLLFLAFTSHREARHGILVSRGRLYIGARSGPSSGDEVHVMIDGGFLAYRSGIALLCSIHTRFTYMYMYMNMPLPVTFCSYRADCVVPMPP
jgi:hypothetical protein